MKSIWLTNTNPKYPPVAMFGQTQEEADLRYKKWLAGKRIGSPKATEAYTVEQLEARGMVGVYREYEDGE